MCIANYSQTNLCRSVTNCLGEAVAIRKADARYMNIQLLETQYLVCSFLNATASHHVNAPEWRLL